MKPLHLHMGTLHTGEEVLLYTNGEDWFSYDLDAASFKELDFFTYAHPTTVRKMTWEECQRHALRLSQNLVGFSGTDPEIFVRSGIEGPIIPAWKFLPPEKDAAVYKGVLNGRIRARMRAYWDGFQAELSHRPSEKPRYCHEHLASDVQEGLAIVLGNAYKYDLKAVLAPEDVVEVDPVDLQKGDACHIELGCAPSMNAYGIEPIGGLKGRELPIRFSGCHLHFSADIGPLPELPPWFPNGTVAMMDKIAGVMLTALGRGHDNPKRRKYYGRPGEYRLPHTTNGTVRIEYRTPGSILMRHPAAFFFGADVARAAFKLGLVLDGFKQPGTDEVIRLIKDCDADAAVRMIRSEPIYYNVLERVYGESTATKSMDTLAKGLLMKQLPTVAVAWRMGNFGHLSACEWAYCQSYGYMG